MRLGHYKPLQQATYRSRDLCSYIIKTPAHDRLLGKKLRSARTFRGGAREEMETSNAFF